MERQLGLLKYMDYVQHENFDFVFQPKILKRYEEQLIKPLVMEEPDVGEKWDELRVQPALDKILTESETIARAHGYKTSVMKRFNRLNIIILTVVFGVLLVTSFIPGLANFSNVIMIPALLLFCFLPQILKKKMLGAWVEFKKKVESEFRERCEAELARVHEFVQFLIDNTRQLFIDAEVPLNAVRFVLTANTYEHLRFVQEQLVNNRRHYVFEFAYPPGMEPPQYAQVAPAPTPADAGENDEFGLVKIKDMDAQFHVKEFEFTYLPKALQDKVNDLLDHADFDEATAADDFFTSLHGKLHCQCDPEEVLRLENGQLCEWHSKDGKAKFKFFFASTKPCKCGKQTYLLSAKPGNVPARWKPVFQLK